MNSRSLVIGLLLLVAFSMKAQGPHYPIRSQDASALLEEGPIFGLKAGVDFPRLYYTNPYLSSALQHDFIMSPSASFFYEKPFLKRCTFAIELNYQQRGGAFTYDKSGVDETYRLQAQYVSLRVPVFLYLPLSHCVQPYLFVAPDAGCVVGGDIFLTHPNGGLLDQSVDINYSNINYAYLGALGGLGIRFNIPLSRVTIVIKLDAAVNYGLTDTYSKFEHHGTAHAINGINSYYIDGKRYSRGLECHLSLGFFLKKLDACGWF